MGFLIDTNVVSELRKGDRCDRGVMDWFRSVSDDELYLSVLVVGELRRGVELLRRRDPKSAERLHVWMRELVESAADRILPVSQEIAERWACISVPDPLPMIDGLLAATAIVHDHILVTRNVADVARTQVRLLNPFASQPG